MGYSKKFSADGFYEEMGYKYLGPIIHRWLLSLDQHVAFFDSHDTSFLYCARAGVRIKKLYEIYLNGYSRNLPENHHMFWVSRLALCKGVFSRSPGPSAEVISREFHDTSLQMALDSVLRNLDIPSRERIDYLHGNDLACTPHDFISMVNEGNASSNLVRKYFNDNGEAFSLYLNSLVKGSERVVLVDSGWQGTSQSLLTSAFSEYDWFGLYFGRILTGGHDKSIVDSVIGLMFESNDYNQEVPESAFVLHRHLIESLLEPNAPSIEEVLGGPCDDVANRQINANKLEACDPEEDFLYVFVKKYLEDFSGLGISEIHSRYQSVIHEFSDMLVHPTREQALSLCGKSRSADFGKSLKVPVIITSVDDECGVEDRIQSSLWPQGQIALEYNGSLRVDLQNRATGISDNEKYFDPVGNAHSHEEVLSQRKNERPLVAIITRTKNRPILLQRAAKSVAEQVYDNYLWVVVNDGGDENLVKDVIENCYVDRRKIRLVSNSYSLGMEAASNVGVKSFDSDYVLIHDDDDAIHPNFLKTAIDYLESSSGKRYGGLVTGAEYVSEEIRGFRVIEHGRIPYMDWVRNVHISEMLANNMFAPISFVYRREIYDEIGGYNEDLPVLGDWFFNLEFILRHDIRVIPEVLSYYHHRDKGDSSRSGIYSNSVIGGQSKHEEFSSICRNMFIRKYSEKYNPAAVGAISSYFSHGSRGILQSILSGSHGVSKRSSDLNEYVDEIDRLWLICLAYEKKENVFSHDISGLDLDTIVDMVIKEEVEITPHPSFDEEGYLKNNPDVMEAVRDGFVFSGYLHYLVNGRSEGRERTMTKCLYH